jgi:hypothetical protein
MGIKTKVKFQCRVDEHSEWRECSAPGCTNQKRSTVKFIISEDIMKIMRGES